MLEEGNKEEEKWKERNIGRWGKEEEVVVLGTVVVSSRCGFLTLVRACPRRFSNAFKLR